MRLNLAWKPSWTPFLEPLSCHKQHIKKKFGNFFFGFHLRTLPVCNVFDSFFPVWTRTNFARGCQANAMLIRHLWTIGKLHQLSILPQNRRISEIWWFKVLQYWYFTSYRNGNSEKLHICRDFDGLLVTSKMFFRPKIIYKPLFQIYKKGFMWKNPKKKFCYSLPFNPVRSATSLARQWDFNQ